MSFRQRSGASRARTGDLLGAIGPEPVRHGQARLAQVTLVTSGSLRCAQFGITIGSTGVGPADNLSSGRVARHSPPRASATASSSVSLDPASHSASNRSARRSRASFSAVSAARPRKRGSRGCPPSSPIVHAAESSRAPDRRARFVRERSRGDQRFDRQRQGLKIDCRPQSLFENRTRGLVLTVRNLARWRCRSRRSSPPSAFQAP